MRLQSQRREPLSARLVFAAALIGLSLIATGPPARAAETEAHLNGAAKLRAAALVEERKHPAVAERFERLWNKSLWLVGCGAGFGRGSPHLIPEDTIQRADDDTHRLIEWAQLQGLRDWSELMRGRHLDHRSGLLCGGGEPSVREPGQLRAHGERTSCRRGRAAGGDAMIDAHMSAHLGCLLEMLSLELRIGDPRSEAPGAPNRQ